METEQSLRNKAIYDFWIDRRIPVALILEKFGITRQRLNQIVRQVEGRPVKYGKRYVKRIFYKQGPHKK